MSCAVVQFVEVHIGKNYVFCIMERALVKMTARGVPFLKVERGQFSSPTVVF